MARAAPGSAPGALPPVTEKQTRATWLPGALAPAPSMPPVSHLRPLPADTAFSLMLRPRGDGVQQMLNEGVDIASLSQMTNGGLQRHLSYRVKRQRRGGGCVFGEGMAAGHLLAALGPHLESMAAAAAASLREPDWSLSPPAPKPLPPRAGRPPGRTREPLPACPASWIQGYFFLKDMTKGDQCTMFFIFLHDLLWKQANEKLGISTRTASWLG